MILNLISLATVKTELGLTVTTHDTAITAMIPKVSADVRRILNTNYDDYYDCSFSTAADSLGSLYARPVIPMGTVVYHPELPDDTYINGYSPITGTYTISATPNDEGSYVFPTVNIAQQSTMSKMIWYRIQGLNITDYNDKKVASECYGKISKSYAASEINTKWNYPQALIDDLGTPYARIG